MNSTQALVVADPVEQCEIDLTQKRNRLAHSLSRLRQRVVEASDWRTHYARHPAAAVALFLTAGWLVGTLSLGSARSRH